MVEPVIQNAVQAAAQNAVVEKAAKKAKGLPTETEIETKTFRTACIVELHGERYAAGEAIELTESEFLQLAASGALII